MSISGRLFGIWAYLERMAVTTGADSHWVSQVVGNAAYLGIVGALIPIWIGDRYGRKPMVVAGVLLIIVGMALLKYAENQALYITSNVILNIAWSSTIAYLLAAAASSETSGRAAVSAGVASKLGIAAGPLIAAAVLTTGSDSFDNVIYVGMLISVLCLALSWSTLKRTEDSQA